MKLFYSPNSPFARKCRVVTLEKKLEHKIELVNVNPLANPIPADLLIINPLGRVPAFVTEQGLHLCESSVICEYIDGLSTENPLYPKEDRTCVLAMAAMADGIMDSAVSCVMEGRRPADKQYPEWVERKQQAIMRAIAKFAAVPLAQTPLSIGTINLAIALAYIDFRLPHIGWRKAHPQLAQWLDIFSTRKSFQETKPQA